MGRFLAPLPAVLVALIGVGCGAASGGAPYRGVQVYGEGADVYVCREAPTAPSEEVLATELRDQDQDRDSPTGQSVTIQERGTVEVRGGDVAVARVSPVDENRPYWIPYTALCSRRSGG